MKKNELVIHHNYLNESKFVDFTELELNLFITIIYQMRKENLDTEIIFKSEDIKKMVNSKDRSYKEFERIIHSLQDRTFYLKTANGYERIKPFPTLIFNNERKTITIDINKRMIPIFKELKQQFTQYSLKEFILLENKYGKRLFQLLKQYESIGKRVFKLEDLKEVLDCNNKSYDKMSNLDKKVLEKAKNDINSKTSLDVDYKKIKNGRRVESIEFNIRKTNKDTPSDNLKRNIKMNKNTENTKKKVIQKSENETNKDTLSDKIIKKILKVKQNRFILKAWNKRTKTKIIKIYREEGEEYLLKLLEKLRLNVKSEIKTTVVQYINGIIEKSENQKIKKKVTEYNKIDILNLETKSKKVKTITYEEFYSLDKINREKLEENAIEKTIKSGEIERDFILELKKKSKRIYFNTIVSNIILNQKGGNDESN